MSAASDRSPAASSENARATMRATKRRDTGPELALRRELHRRGMRFRVDHAGAPTVRCRADLVFTRARVAVFVDGCFWHRCPEHGTLPRANGAWWEEKLNRNVARDRRNDREYAQAGWHVVRVWEHELVSAAADRVAAAVRARASELASGSG